MLEGQATFRGWEYARRGDYHRNLDPRWSYTPTYLIKMNAARRFLYSLERGSRTVDVGCGEGVLVEEFRNIGFDIEGLDLNYESSLVRKGDVTAMPYGDATLDAVLFLDTLEHLSFQDQPKALAEIHRVLRLGGRLCLSVPNLAHLNSRLSLLLAGRLDRTDSVTNHVGERPRYEYEALLRQAGFHISARQGITLTLPFVYRQVIARWPHRFRWLHDALDPFARAFPSLAMVTIFTCQAHD